MGFATEALVTVAFLLFSLCQLNDEDYYVWVPVYLLPAALNAVFAISPPTPHSKLFRPYKAIIFAHSHACIVLSIYSVWNKNWSYPLPKIRGWDLLVDPAFEVERELVGLWLCLVWAHFRWPIDRRSGKEPSRFSRKRATAKSEE